MQRLFGTLPGGTPIHAITLDSGTLQAEILTWGGVLRRLVLVTADGPIDVVLGLPDLQHYLDDRDNLGILVGRFGNRIAGATYAHEGTQHRLSANEGDNHLHGGHEGFGRRVWEVLECGPRRLLLGRVSPDGEEGYPGQLRVEAEFVVEGERLLLTWRARSDAPTPVNLTHHPYFNLAGDPAIAAASQQLRVPADHYLPVGAGLIPTGAVDPVDGGPFDFRTPSTLSARTAPDNAQLRQGNGFDHCLVLAAQADCTAELYSPHSGVAMRIRSPMPAVQLYEGQGLDSSQPALGRGLCLEPQGFPDAPNHAHFPSAMLLPGELYEHRIEYRFALPGTAAPWHRVSAALDAAG